MKIPKVLVRYLPQFHEIPENDKWWGKGFTEWRAVRGGIPLFSGHNQPREPFKDNYYNLLDKETMQWQAELAKQYRIGGFSFYHYWFKDGKKILEKPAENLLSWKDIDMPFCFTWANETWARTWSKLNQKNAWAENLETNDFSDENSTGILLEQKYGTEKEWRDHFEYLLPFFKDERYLQIENKPIFIIYKPDDIPSLKPMLEYWDKLIKKEGFSGLYIIGETWTNYIPLENLDARLLRFPNTALQTIAVHKVENSNVNVYSYDECWNVTLKENYVLPNGKKSFLCGVVDYDTTPRKGERGEVLRGANPVKFRTYFEKFIEKNLEMNNEYVFLNAWNEWGEGMYLEPDKKNGDGYLQAIKEVMDKYSTAMRQTNIKVDTEIKSPITIFQQDEKIELMKRQLYKARKCFNILNIWMDLKERNISVAQYLLEKEYTTIAIYGLGIMGLHLIEELRDTKIEISYIIDKAANGMNSRYPLYNLQTGLPNVDLIIVTPTCQYEEIKTEIKRFTDYPTVSLEELIFECQ